MINKKLIYLVLLLLFISGLCVRAQENVDSFSNNNNKDILLSDIPDWYNLKKNGLTQSSNQKEMKTFFEKNDNPSSPFSKYLETILKNADETFRVDNSIHADSNVDAFMKKQSPNSNLSTNAQSKNNSSVSNQDEGVLHDVSK